MKIRRFNGASTRDVLQQIRTTLGADAVILSNRDVDGGVEIVAAIDFDEKQWTEVTPTPSWPEPLRGVPAKLPEENVLTMSTKPPLAVPERVAPMAVSSSATTGATPLRNELQALRQLVEKRWGSLRASKQAREVLTDMGFSAGWAAQIAQQAAEEAWEAPLRAVLEERVGLSENPLDKGGIFAVLGPTGSGKTTSIAKLAAAQVLRHGPHSVALLTTDTYRIAGVEQLGIYARILGVPLEVIRGPEDLFQALEKHCQRPWIFIDTIGMSPRDQRLGEQLQWLAALGPQAHRFLLISAGLSDKSLSTVLAPYADLPLAGAILSKVDEAPAFGGALEWLAQHHLPIAYYSDGQKVPEDLHEARWDALIHILQSVPAGDAVASTAHNRYHGA
ncbi:flagellar biosynthesis protein FlhF [Acidithiobacillus sp.]|jgi:flagellar biosynthesis protein FlhF|uniref:flagellar biosynthesis protein FlhF n=1 Tax=Acidithiobacillus sp. TaxID=1872118 RepID=UPI0025B7D582|nr:flagellar biosynthesis protein FlhF [Acidithiobacillus sp.]MCK9187618.1 flagellar biosynthesis protein FlhF [Acidithiobacillus sp.]MCK9358508.1 flagellar biosynthesis protein FlhF [Acidithiobacillus sp.]